MNYRIRLGDGPARESGKFSQLDDRAWQATTRCAKHQVRGKHDDGRNLLSPCESCGESGSRPTLVVKGLVYRGERRDKELRGGDIVESDKRDLTGNSVAVLA